MKSSDYKVVNQDINTWLDSYEGEKFDCLLSDPPYALNFMNKSWDKGDLVFDKDFWAKFHKITTDDLIGMAFSSTRTFHRMASAIENAGFHVHPEMYLYVFGSGFPKASDVSKMMDKQAGVKGKVTGYRNPQLDGSIRTPKIRRPIEEGGLGIADGLNQMGLVPVIEPVSPEAKQWDGWKYGLQALKPAYEPIILFSKKPEASKDLENKVKFIYSTKVPQIERNEGLSDLNSKELIVYSDFRGNPEHAPKKDVLAKNNHPTMKSIDLTSKLSKLIKELNPEAKRIVIPFSGSGSEMLGAMEADFDYIEGVEKESEYADVSNIRLKYKAKKKRMALF